MPNTETIEQAIEHQIMARTQGRIHRLKVEVLPDRVVVEGCTTTYHARQLAFEATLEVVRELELGAPELNIIVAPYVQRFP